MGFGSIGAAPSGSAPTTVYYDRIESRQTYGAAGSQTYTLPAVENMETDTACLIFEIDWYAGGGQLQLRVDGVAVNYDFARAYQAGGAPAWVTAGGTGTAQATMTDATGVNTYNKVFLKIWKFGRHLYYEGSFLLANQTYGYFHWMIAAVLATDTISSITVLATVNWNQLRITPYKVRLV